MALSIFMRRRNKLAIFCTSEIEAKFLVEGCVQEISGQVMREPSISRKLANGQTVSYSLPNQTKVQLHKKGCQKLQIENRRQQNPQRSESFDFVIQKTKYKIEFEDTNSRVFESSLQTTAFVRELQANQTLSDLIQSHGGFWMQVLTLLSENKLHKRGQTSLNIPGSFEFSFLDDTIHERMAKAKVSTVEVTDLLQDSLEECPCFGLEKCMFCENQFIPTGWSYVDLRLGKRVCILCAQLAADGRQLLPWLEMSKEQISEEIAFGLDLQSNLMKIGTLNFDQAPQHDSRIAFQKLRLHSLSDEDFVKNFLTVALRPKEQQVRLIFGYWEQWLHSIGLGNGHKILGLDGHSCNSSGEKAICDYLYQNGIPHRREPKYSEYVAKEWESLVRHFKGDFEVDGVIYEYAGMQGEVDYEYRLITKVREASNLGLKVVVIRPGDLNILNEFFIAT